MDNDSGKAFDSVLFKRLLAHTRPYKITFYGVAVAAILLSVFSVLTPLLVKEIIDDAIRKSNADKLLYLTLAMLAVLIGQVTCQLLFNYYANCIRESIIKDIRINLFRRMLGFKMK